MPIFAVYRREADTCGWEDVHGPIRYIKADSLQQVEKVFIVGFLVGYYVEEIVIESIHELTEEKWWKLK